MVVKSLLAKVGLHPIRIELGEIELEESTISEVKSLLQRELQLVGFELLDDKKTKIIEKIKTTIVTLIQNKNATLSTNLSDYLAQELKQEYSTLSHLFSEIEGTTIEKYFILQKIEKVKELLAYDELTLSEIAFQLNYSSVAYLSNQFKKVTGLTPSHFKKVGSMKRKPIEEL